MKHGINLKKIPVSYFVWSVLFVIPLWTTALWAFGSGFLIVPYLVPAYLIAIICFIKYLLFPDSLFWNFALVTFTGFAGMILGLVLITAALIILAFGKIISLNIIILGIFSYYAFYCIYVFRFYLKDFEKTKKDRLKSFDFENGTYDLATHSLIRDDAFSDFYFKSFLYKAHYVIVGLYIIIPVGGGAIAIIAGNISKKLQLGIGLFAIYLTTIVMIQFTTPGFSNIWQVVKLEKKYNKKFRIIDSDEEQ